VSESVQISADPHQGCLRVCSTVTLGGAASEVPVGSGVPSHRVWAALQALGQLEQRMAALAGVGWMLQHACSNLNTLALCALCLAVRLHGQGARVLMS
jgi:hypothetical protein